jgi:hypothetical protein
MNYAEEYDGDSPQTVRNKERYREQNGMNCGGPYHKGCEKCEPEIELEESEDDE